MGRHVLHIPVTDEEHELLTAQARETHASLPNYTRKLLGLAMPPERRGKHNNHFRGKRPRMTQKSLFTEAPKPSDSSTDASTMSPKRDDSEEPDELRNAGE